VVFGEKQEVHQWIGTWGKMWDPHEAAHRQSREHVSNKDLKTRSYARWGSSENNRRGENAQPTSSVPFFSPLKVVLEASNSLKGGEVVIKLSSVFPGGQPLRSPRQHHLSLAAAYPARGEVHRELQDRRKQGRKGFQSRQVVVCIGRDNKQQGGDSPPRRPGTRREEAWNPPSQKLSLPLGWKGVTSSLLSFLSLLPEEQLKQLPKLVPSVPARRAAGDRVQLPSAPKGWSVPPQDTPRGDPSQAAPMCTHANSFSPSSGLRFLPAEAGAFNARLAEA